MCYALGLLVFNEGRMGHSRRPTMVIKYHSRISVYTVYMYTVYSVLVDTQCAHAAAMGTKKHRAKQSSPCCGSMMLGAARKYNKVTQYFSSSEWIELCEPRDRLSQRRSTLRESQRSTTLLLRLTAWCNGGPSLECNRCNFLVHSTLNRKNNRMKQTNLPVEWWTKRESSRNSSRLATTVTLSNEVSCFFIFLVSNIMTMLRKV